MRDTYTGIIWYNDCFEYNGEHFIISHLSRAGILGMNNIPKYGNIDELGIYQKLAHKAGFYFELSRVKFVLPNKGIK